MPFKTLLLGTGIAGLCAGIALSDKGHTVAVVEETSELKTVGGIIAIHANANRMLDQMGVYQEMLRIYGTEPVHVNEAHVWRLQERIVPSWVGKKGKVVLGGNAAHPVLPYVGQGVSKQSRTPHTRRAFGTSQIKKRNPAVSSFQPKDQRSERQACLRIRIYTSKPCHSTRWTRAAGT